MRIQEKKSRGQIVQEHLEKNGLYKSKTQLGYSVKEISRYAKEKKCKISDLTAEDISKFKNAKDF